MERSTCCQAPVRTVGHTSRFYVCRMCNKPTDLVKTNQLSIMTKESKISEVS